MGVVSTPFRDSEALAFLAYLSPRREYGPPGDKSYITYILIPEPYIRLALNAQSEAANRTTQNPSSSTL